MLSDEVAGSLARFFDQGKGPSHDELTRLISRAGLSNLDPSTQVGKMKRVRAVLYGAAESAPESGQKLVDALLQALRGAGSFRPGSPNYAGEDLIMSLAEALRAIGYDLRPDGVATTRSLEGLEGLEMTEALQSYVRRARAGSDDLPLVVGTAKDLTEATARHVLVEVYGTYERRSHFQQTLWEAYEALDLATVPPNISQEVLRGDEWAAVQRSLYLLGCAVNRLRNAQGTGHGRPEEHQLGDHEARIAAQTAALVSDLLLSQLEIRRSK